MIHSTKTLVVHVLNQNKSVDIHHIPFSAPANILELLNANKMSINQSCGGNGTCTTCRFVIQTNPNAFSERTELENERAQERQFGSIERLSCQTEILDSAEIEIPGFID